MPVVRASELFARGVPAQSGAAAGVAPPNPPTTGEIRRRRRVVAQMLKLRDEMGPIDLTSEELLALEEDEVDA